FVLNKGLLQYTNVILRNIIYKYINEKAKDKLIESIPIDCESDSETISDSYICVDPETEDLLQYIKAVITKLSKNCQIIFLAFLQGYELNDVLNDFFPNTPRGTFDNMVWRCRKSLKIELKKEGCLDGLYKS
ncbi:MAG: hypothetical protein M1419_03635, partial [Bacteroidetes bacterium]|nr:hypothetical protein [Bacteroidota bacterium]